MGFGAVGVCLCLETLALEDEGGIQVVPAVDCVHQHVSSGVLSPRVTIMNRYSSGQGGCG